MADELGNVASAVKFGMNPTALGGAGLALGVASSVLGGKPNSKWEPMFRTDNGYYEMSKDMGRSWNPVPENYDKRPTDNGLLRASEILGVKRPGEVNDVNLPTGQTMNMATGKISGQMVASQDIRKPYEMKAGDYRLPDGSILATGSGKIVNTPNYNHPGPYIREDKMIQSFGRYMAANKADYYGKPSASANVLAQAEAAKAKRYSSLLSRPASRDSTATTSSILAKGKV